MRRDRQALGRIGQSPSARRSCTGAPTRGGAGSSGWSSSPSILGGLLTGGYFAVDALADYLDRDRLPSPGVDSAEVRSATYHVQSGPRCRWAVGDITVDHGNGTYRFQGAADTDLAGVEIVGDAAGRLALRRDGRHRGSSAGRTRVPSDSSPSSMYLDVVDTDDVLTTTWRDGYVSIDDREKRRSRPQESTRRRCTRSCSTPRATRPTTRSSGTSGSRRCSRCRLRSTTRSSRCGSTATA